MVKNLSEIVLVYVDTADSNQLRWESLVRLVKKSEIKRLVVVDKSTSKNLTRFIGLQTLQCIVKIIQSSVSENLPQTWTKLELKSNEWIIQFHEDDNWLGRLSSSVLSGKSDVVLLPFAISIKGKLQNERKGRNLPNRIMFSLISARVWHTYQQFALTMQNQVGTSTDYILYKIAQCFSITEVMTDFKYVYSADNWKSKFKSRKKLSNFSRLDGWGLLSSFEALFVGRALDCLAFANTEAGRIIGFQYSLEDLKKQIRPLLKYAFVLDKVMFLGRKVGIRLNEETDWHAIYNFLQGLTRATIGNEVCSVLASSRNSVDLRIYPRFDFWQTAIVKLSP